MGIWQMCIFIIGARIIIGHNLFLFSISTAQNTYKTVRAQRSPVPAYKVPEAASPSCCQRTAYRSLGICQDTSTKLNGALSQHNYKYQKNVGLPFSTNNAFLPKYFKVLNSHYLINLNNPVKQVRGFIPMITLICKIRALTC